ncbi:MAG: hypothetical protein VB876_16135 [Pirellulales bacterium]
MTAKKPPETSNRGPHGEARTGDNACTFGANAVRLTARDWTTAAALVLIATIATPAIWEQLETFEPGPNYRVPYDLTEDYWTYQRAVEKAVDRDRIVVIGDSVMWGEYVIPQQTLPQHLNELHGHNRFANGGLNGGHPLALQGLIAYYADGINDTRVILHCNLLWMSFKERDLQIDKELAFNHPRLVSQFSPAIPCYKAPLDARMSIAIDRVIPFRTWGRHWRIADLGGQDLPGWTLEHPYANPLSQIRLESPPPKSRPHSRPISWTERKIKPQNIPWIDPDTSLQWRAFRATVDLLQHRGNRLFVIVGPFNEHMLTEASQRRYRNIRRQVEDWLRDRAIPHQAPALLPSPQYADASHPLSAGYAQLAEQVYTNAGFQKWLSD